MVTRGGYIRVQIAPEYIEESLRTGSNHRGFTFIEGLPEDAVLVNAAFSAVTLGGPPVLLLHFRTATVADGAWETLSLVAQRLDACAVCGRPAFCPCGAGMGTGT